MRGGRIKPGIGVAVAAAIAVLLLLFRSREAAQTSFDGQPVEQWFYKYCWSAFLREEAGERQVAWEALREMGKDAVPFLVREAFRREPPGVVAKAFEEIRKRLDLREPERPPVVFRRIHAVSAVGGIRPPAKLLLPLVKKALERRTGEEYFTALRLLGCVGDGAEAAARLLGEALRDPNPQTRHCAAEALAHLGADARVALPAMLEALEESLPQPNPHLLVALRNCGAAAKAALPALERLLSTSPAAPPPTGSTLVLSSGMEMPGEANVALSVALTLVALQPDHGPAWAAITNALLTATNPVQQLHVLRHLDSIDAQAQRLAPYLSHLARSAHPEVSWQALRHLQRLAPEKAAPLLLWNLNQGGNHLHRCWAAGVLLNHQAYQAQARSFLLSCLADRRREQWRPIAALELARASPNDAAVRLALEHVANDQSDPARQAAKLALSRLRLQPAKAEAHPPSSWSGSPAGDP